MKLGRCESYRGLFSSLEGLDKESVRHYATQCVA